MLDRIKYFFLNNKKWVLIGAAILILAIIAISFIPKKQQEKTPATETKIPGEEIIASPTLQKTELTDEDKVKSTIMVMGRSFAQAYGSYSNQSNYSNLESVLPLSSSEYRIEISETLKNYRASYKPGEKYEGVTTVYVGNTIEALDLGAGAATVLVKTQRKISKDTQANYTLKNQDIRLEMVKEGDNWLVDKATWIE